MPGPSRVNTPTSGGRGFPMVGSGVGPNDPLDHSERGAVVRPTVSLDLSDYTNQAGADQNLRKLANGTRKGANAGSRSARNINTPSSP